LAITDSTAARYTTSDPDVRLMLRVRDDDASAFEELMLRYQDRVVALLTHMVGRNDLAEDLAQDVFLRVYRVRKRYLPGAKFSTWLFTIVHNVAFNARRSLSRRKEVNLGGGDAATKTPPLESAAVAASGLMPARQLDKSELREIVQVALGQLNERQRTAVVLHKFEQLSYIEISEIMGLSTSAIKSLLARARSNLRDVLQPYLENGRRVETADAATNTE
jgi:RNA polymerase sigma-70 factor (ECF subfamily)